jgi:Zn-dependent peptidase ImmA (M78 family)
VVALSRSQIEEQARQLLKDHDLYRIPVDPVVLANHLGIRVNNAKFSEENLSGMVSKRGNLVQILVNQSDQGYRKRFTIAHEIGHYLLHLQDKDGQFADREADLFRTEPGEELQPPAPRQHEVEANRFAAALLMDEELVRSQWGRVRSMKAMSRLFNVSESAIGYRIGALGLE